MGLDKCWMVKYSGLSSGTYTDISFTCGFGYYSCTWNLQLIWGVFHLDMSFIWWFMVITVLVYGFWSCHTWRSWWSGVEGNWLKDTTMVDLNALLEAFWTCPEICLFHWWHFFSGEMYNFQFWDYSPEVPDYPEFLIMWCWIKAIFVVFLVSFYDILIATTLMEQYPIFL